MKTRYLIISCSIALFLSVLLCGGHVCAQTSHSTRSPFTVLSNNADTGNHKLYVEIMYEKSACGDYKAQFRLAHKGNRKGSPIAVDQFLNNPGTYTTETSGPNKNMSLMRPQAGGYRLSFSLEKPGLPGQFYGRGDSVEICVDAYRMAYRCVGCGAGGSDAIFGPEDVDNACPYIGGDLLACYRRESTAGNWEAWIQDPRDCKSYRIIQLRDGKWWFAQNLNYTKDLQYGAGLGQYLCPSGKSLIMNRNFINGDTTLVGNSATCATYGALYSWQTAMAYNGRTNTVDASTPTPIGGPSNTQGICPDGWLVPADYDWGALLNAVEDSCTGNYTSFSSTAPCNHNRNDATLGNFGTPRALANLKTLHSCRPHNLRVDSICARNSYPAWVWRRADYNGRISAPYAIATNKYGFSMLPAGYYNSGNSKYSELGKTAMFWTSSNLNSANAYSRTLTAGAPAGRTSSNKGYGASLRCMVAMPVIAIANAAYTFEPSLALSVTRLANPSTFTYEWSSTPDNGKLSFSKNGTTDAQRVAANMSGVTAGTTYTLTVNATSTESGKSVTSTAAVTVTEYKPTITAPDSILWLDGLNLSITPTNLNLLGYTYTWSVSPDNGRFSFPNNGTITAHSMDVGLDELLTTDGGMYTFTCKVLSIATGASVTKSKEVHIKTCPMPAQATVSYTCDNDQTVTITASLPNDVNWANLDSVIWGSDKERLSDRSAKTATKSVTLTTESRTIILADQNGCYTLPATLPIYKPTTAAFTTAPAQITYTLNSVSANSIGFTMSDFGGGGTAHATPYGYAIGDSSAVPDADSMSWQATATRASAPITLQPAVAAGVAPTLWIRTRDDKTCLSDAGKTAIHPAIPADVMFCAGCAYRDDNNVADLWVKTIDETSKRLSSVALSANSPRDGRANTAAISDASGQVYTCKSYGTGWYLPAYAEALRIMTDMIEADGQTINNKYSYSSASNNYRYWTSTFGYNNSVYYHTPVGMRSYTSTHYVLYYTSYTSGFYARCVWRP